MTYKTLDMIIAKLAEKAKLPRERLERFEMALGMRNGFETVLLFGLLPENGNGVRPFVTASCRVLENYAVKDSMRIDVCDPRQYNGWVHEFYELGQRLGFDRDYLEPKIFNAFQPKGRFDDSDNLIKLNCEDEL